MPTAPKRTLHRADWIVPVSRPPIAGGGVVTAAGRILAVGPFHEVAGEADRILDHEGQMVLPALINGHCHLELSGLAALGRHPSGHSPLPDLPAWIDALLQERAAAPSAAGERVPKGRLALQQLRASGTGLVLDIGNAAESAAIGRQSETEVLFLQELLGLTEAAATARLAELAAGIQQQCTAHAPYSTAARLLQGLKERARRRQHLFSLHVAESVEEIELLRTGRGPFRRFLEARSVWDGSLAVPGCGAGEYLDRLGLLDGKTLCVHCVHLSAGEIELLAARGSRVCLCPGSNRYLRVGTAPAPAMLKAGLRPALGTDSLASNPCLNLWQEMRLLREDHPGLDPGEVLAMATRNGAEALGRGQRLGTLEPGKSALLLAVRAQGASAHDVLETLTSLGESAEVQWLQ